MNVLRLFLSSSPDLRNERRLVAEIFARMGVQVVTQEMFNPASESIVEVIRRQIEASDCFIQLIGFDAGASPPSDVSRPFGASGSYFQIAGTIAQSLGKPTYFFFADRTAADSTTSKESVASMEAYRANLQHKGLSYYMFKSPEELRSLISKIDLLNWLAEGRDATGFRIFLSYRRQDLVSKCVTHRIFEGLSETFGHDHVFMDAHSIPLGQDYRKYLDTSVARANFMCAIVGPSWVSTLQNRSNDPKDYVRYEIESAFRLSIPVSPILLEDTELPNEQQIPESLHPLIVSQGLRIRVGSELFDDIRELSTRIRSLAPKPER